MIKLALDMHGQEGSIKISINAALIFLKKFNDVQLYLVGNEKELKKDNRLAKFSSKVKYVNAIERIEHSDGILEIRRKKNSSLVKLIELVKNKEVDGIISAGPSGPYVAGAYLILGAISKGVRPAFAPVIPSIDKNRNCIFLDAGANSDATSKQIVQFAYMGKIFSKCLGMSDNPEIKLLNIGVEEKKGNDIYIDAHKLLSREKERKKLNFSGNIEPNKIFAGKTDVIVAGGFEGNIASKSIEGSIELLSKEMKKNFKKNPKSLFGASLLKKSINESFRIFDSSEIGGALILGVNGIALKVHGSATSKGIYNALKSAKLIIEKNAIEQLRKELKNVK